MKKPVLMFSLLSGTVLMFPKLTIASGLPAHTHTYTPEPKPAFQFEQPDKAYKTASVCFLGSANCGDAGFGSMGGDSGYKVDTVQQCGNEGYSVTSCSLLAYPSGQCPYNGAYFAKCIEDRPRACRETGYVNSCDDGYIPDNSQSCPYDSSYQKCKCNPCNGYDYTLEEANAEGYEAGAVCNSCGTMKYQRRDAACNGFLHCDCGGEVGAASCYSGSIQKFKSCKKCCSACASGTSLSCASDYYPEEKGKDSCGNLCYSCYKGRIHIYGYWGSTNYCYPNCTVPNYSYVRYATEYKYCEYKDGSKKLLSTEELEGCFASLASNCNDDAVGGDWNEYFGFCN